MLRRALALLALVACSDAFITFGIEGKCTDILCTQLSLDFTRFDDIVKEYKITLIPKDDPDNILAIKRFHTYDNTTQTYYFASLRQADQKGYPPNIQLFTIAVGNTTLLHTATVDTSVYQNLTTIHYDPTTKTLFGVYANVLATINTLTGAVTEVAVMWDTATSFYENRISDLDPATGRLFISVHQYKNDSYHIATFNTRSLNLIISPPVGYNKLEFDQALPEGIAYNPNDGLLYLLAEDRYGANWEVFDSSTQGWKTIMSANNPEMTVWDAYDYQSVRGQEWWFNAPSGKFVAMMANGSEDPNNPIATIVEFDTKTVQMGATWGASIDYSNFIVFEV